MATTAKPPKKKTSKILKIFLTTLTVILSIFAILSTIALLAFDRISDPIGNRDITTGLRGSGSITDILRPIPSRTTVLVIGLDDHAEGGTMLADFLMLGVYNSNSGAVDFISIPRDTMVVVPQERYDTFRWKPRSTTVKINGIFNYAGSRDNGILLTVAQVEDLFNVSIDYYVTVELDGFRKLIDDVGGIEFDVPQRMYYTDPCQDLYIDLHPGLQRLSGIQAEGLVRYRRADIWNPQSPGYAMGDLRRVQVQQDFIAAAMKQILSSGRGFTALANMAMSNVRTNFPAVDIPRYAPEMLKIDTSAINTQTLPGTATNYSPWFYLPDVDGITKLVNEIYFANNQ